jgi:hypothetical protein
MCMTHWLVSTYQTTPRRSRVSAACGAKIRQTGQGKRAKANLSDTFANVARCAEDCHTYVSRGFRSVVRGSTAHMLGCAVLALWAAEWEALHGKRGVLQGDLRSRNFEQLHRYDALCAQIRSAMGLTKPSAVCQTDSKPASTWKQGDG